MFSILYSIFTQVYMLSWIERQAAATLFGASISANVDDALKQFLEASVVDKPCFYYIYNFLNGL